MSPDPTPHQDGMLVDESELVETVSGPMTDSLVWATWALFVGLGLMLAGAGVFATLIAQYGPSSTGSGPSRSGWSAGRTSWASSSDPG
ncbi:MAG: hypothetical protein R2715_18375 [Ilumatobacteraceae bacterium]